MVMYDLCSKINWDQSRLLADGAAVPTGCEVRPLTWKLLLFMVIVSLGGQVRFVLIIPLNKSCRRSQVIGLLFFFKIAV